MKVLIVGANGELGRRCVYFALAASHHVTAFVRSKSKFLDSISAAERDHPNLTIFEGSALNLDDLKSAMVGCEAVVNTAGFAAFAPWGSSTLPAIVRNVVDAAKQSLAGAKRVWITAGFFLMDRPGNGLMMDSTFLFRESRQLWEYLQSNGEDLDWTIICPSLMYAGKVQAVEEGVGAPAQWRIPGWLTRFPIIGFFTTSLTTAYDYALSYETYGKYIVDNLENADGRLNNKRVALRAVSS